MARNNELIRLAKKAADAWRNTDTYHQAAQIIDMLVEELEMPTLAPPNEWINMEDRPPEFPGFLDRIMVIACNKNDYVIPMVRERTLVGYEWMERWLYPWNKIYDGPEITHWMPLPESPKEELKNATN